MSKPDYSSLEFWRTATKRQCERYFETHCYKWFTCKFAVCFAYREVGCKRFGIHIDDISEAGLTELQTMRVIGAALQVLEARP